VADLTYSFEASFFSKLLDQNSIQPKFIIVIGCGSKADEAYYVQDATHTFVVGVDLEIRQKPKSEALQIVRCDAQNLPFCDSSFDAIYSYHVLEHVKNHWTAVSEMQRVLAAEGIAFVGTPNKLRLIGYISGRDVTLHKFLIWNLHDYWMRITLRWANDKGAHAGFSDKELKNMLTYRFSSVENVSLDYYESKFPKFKKLWAIIFKLHFEQLIAISLYYLAMKRNRIGLDISNRALLNR
jgi:ubiquinone/menaquinone biosynthesis C-methylase UbiE